MPAVLLVAARIVLLAVSGKLKHVAPRLGLTSCLTAKMRAGLLTSVGKSQPWCNKTQHITKVKDTSSLELFWGAY
jgi:hypothetical protein